MQVVVFHHSEESTDGVQKQPPEVFSEIRKTHKKYLCQSLFFNKVARLGLFTLAVYLWLQSFMRYLRLTLVLM